MKSWIPNSRYIKVTNNKRQIVQSIYKKKQICKKNADVSPMNPLKKNNDSEQNRISITKI